MKKIIKNLDTLGYHRVVFRFDNEPSILAFTPGGEVGLDWWFGARNVR